MKTKATTITTLALSRLLDVSEKTICAWALSGRLVRARHGVFDLRASFAAFARHARGRNAVTLEDIAEQLDWADANLKPLAPGTVITLTDIDTGRDTGQRAIVTEDGAYKLLDAHG